MVSSYLRTNYRRTGAALDIAALGGGIGLASNAGGAGTLKPYGGLIVFSYAMTIAGNSDVAGLPEGKSNAIFDSTYGTTGSFYGAENALSGYAFLPCGWHVISISDVGHADWTGGKSAPALFLRGMALSGSIWRISFAKMSTTGSMVSASTLGCRLLLWGFIASSP